MTPVERGALIALIKWAQSLPVGMGPEHEALSDAYDALEHCIIFEVGPVDPEVRAAYFAPHIEQSRPDRGHVFGADAHMIHGVHHNFPNCTWPEMKCVGHEQQVDDGGGQ
jgi:hypothetical protein